MPTYDYECQKCGHRFMEFQGIAEDKLVDCPECKEPSLKRLIGGGGQIEFKGPGFHETDYVQNDNNRVRRDKSKKSYR